MSLRTALLWILLHRVKTESQHLTRKRKSSPGNLPFANLILSNGPVCLVLYVSISSLFALRIV